ncbi:hypothetical protein DAI22_08g145400 [Oryza sativa Japonica Group]|nr:hypothetical protein DAI22_08g145400 [Oryza sativa Japonica Group]
MCSEPATSVPSKGHLVVAVGTGSGVLGIILDATRLSCCVMIFGSYKTLQYPAGNASTSAPAYHESESLIQTRSI